MKLLRVGMIIGLLLLLTICQRPTSTSASGGADGLDNDALLPPIRPRALAANGASPSRYQPSAFLAGRVVVQVVFVESNGQIEPSTKDWSAAQITAITSQVNTALHWWADRLPNARLNFDLVSKVAPSGYEPIVHGLSTEGLWIGDTFSRMGIGGSNYFDQAYSAADQLRHDRHADWATTIFVANSTGTPGGRFADSHFAYAYVNGPFMVVTSDAGPYGTSRLAPVVAHEFGHIFGALDQYAAAATPCTQQSGYLSIPSTNSQANNCGTHFPSIMLEPLDAYANGQVDTSALSQLGYRDSDNNSLPDPLDTAPALQLQISQPGGGRPVITGQTSDQPFPSPTGESITINTISRVDYRADGGDWLPLAAQDGAYDQASEALNATIPLYDGAHTVELRASNSIGASSPIAKYNLTVSGVGADPHYLLTAPKVSNTTTVNVSISAPAGTTAQISEDPLFGGSAWSAVQPTMPASLGGADGPHTLYVRLRDQAGLVSPAYPRTILLDRTPPSGRALLHTRPSTWLEILASDSTTSITGLQISIDGQPTGSWQSFQNTLPLTLQTTAVTVRLRDEAGNISAPIAAVTGSSIALPLVMR
jgi:hypothetical protein